jgi:hypothetical protein
MQQRNTISELILGIKPSAVNEQSELFLNETHNEVLLLQRTLEIPRIPVTFLDKDSIAPVVSSIAEVIPAFFLNHDFLSQPFPASETHHLHFVQHVKGVSLEFVHVFKLDFRFSSDMGTNHRDGTADFYPSYLTDRILYKSHLVPVDAVEYSEGRITGFTPKRIFRNENIEADKFRFAQTIFDEFDPSEINDKIYENIDSDVFPFSRKIYPFIEYGYFSVIMRIPDPYQDRIADAVHIFEPLCCRVQSVLSGRGADPAAAEKYSEDLVLRDGLLVLNDVFRNKARSFFSRYSIFQNDELALKRWRRLDVSRS